MSQIAAFTDDAIKAPELADANDEFGRIPGFIRPNGFDLSVLSDAQLGIFLSALCNFCYNNVGIKCIQHQGKTYYNRSSSWYTRPEGVGELYDQDDECTGYEHCSYESKKPVALSKDVTFVMMWDEDYGDDEYNEYPQCWNSIVKTLKSCEGPDNVVLFTSHLMLLHNQRGVNDDHRGSDHLQVDVEFTPRSILPPNSSVMSFSQVCHRIKSHRFDYWYELGGICKDNVKTNGNFIDVPCDFDHGS